MTQLIHVRDLPTRLEEVLAQAAAGDDIFVTDDASPRARLLPLPAANANSRILGLHPGACEPTPDFDAPLPEQFWLGQP